MSDVTASITGRNKRKAHTIQLHGTTTSGIGIRIVGGRNIHSKDYSGIFVKELLPGKVAAVDGRLNVGDQILEANSESLVGVSNEKAVKILRECAATGSINFLVARDKETYNEFQRLSKTSHNLQNLSSINTTSSKGQSDHSDQSSDNLSLISDVSSTIQDNGDMLPPPLPNSAPPNATELTNEDKTLNYTEEKNTGPAILVDSSQTLKRHESRFSVKPNEKFKLEKLIWAVEYIGTQLSTEQRGKLDRQLHKDANGKVAFNEFLKLVQEIVPAKFDQTKLLEVFATHQQEYSSATQELDSTKESRVKLIEEKQEMERTIQKLKEELESQTYKQHQLTENDILKTLAAKECQLKKLEASNRRYQVAVEFLLQFVEHCHEALVKSNGKESVIHYPHGTGSSVIRGDQITGNPRPPQYISKHVKKTFTSLANEAKETVAGVRRILAVPELPYGWEEEYTEDGCKFYVNHATQSTSWTLPEGDAL